MKTIPIAGAGILMLAAIQASAQSSTAALPTAALKAWQTHARSYCAEVEERYVGARFAPVPAKGISGDALPAGAGRRHRGLPRPRAAASEPPMGATDLPRQR